ncbi:MAG: hypothetical protein JNG89_17280 [Planctomycetaceae bacterium]|nr:hypothetical protein [Planctomycetaceae bacterium]
MIATPGEYERLLRLGQAIGVSVQHLITIVTCATFRRWTRPTCDHFRQRIREIHKGNDRRRRLQEV